MKKKVDVDAAYSSPPIWYDIRGFFILTFAYRNSILRQISFFSTNLKSPHLEIAIGTGTLFKLILLYRKLLGKPNPRKIAGVDYATRMMEGAKRKFSNSNEIKLAAMDATRMPYKKNTFQSISMANALHCFTNPDAALKEVQRVLKPGGIFRTNALLHPKGIQPFKFIAQKICRWGIKRGILISTFSLADIRKKFKKAKLKIKKQVKSGNTIYIVAGK